LTSHSQGVANAKGASAKIAEQQERFKAGMLADGIDIEKEIVEVERAAAPSTIGIGTNKYAMQMSRHKTRQEQERLRQ
jgi:hypothetical protein